MPRPAPPPPSFSALVALHQHFGTFPLFFSRSRPCDRDPTHSQRWLASYWYMPLVPLLCLSCILIGIGLW